MVVKDLFYNTPARLKFMKKDSAEGAACFADVYKRQAQGGGLRHLAHGKAADALFPEGAGQLHQAGSLAVPGEHAVDHGLTCPLLHHRDIMLQRVPLDDQCFQPVRRLSIPWGC